MEKLIYEEMFKNEGRYWWFVGTRNIIFSQIDCYSKIKCQKVLDIGCGTGIVLKRLINYGEVYGIDISEEAVKFCKKRGIKKTDVTEIISFINKILIFILNIESKVLKKINLPFGISILAVVKKY